MTPNFTGPGQVTLNVPNFFDSHVHWQAFGAKQNRLDLSEIKNPIEVKNLKPTSAHRRGDWIVGFGWNHHQFTAAQAGVLPDKKILDDVFPNQPVSFSRVDGHVAWVNSMALKIAGIESASGILLDTEKTKLESFIPKASPAQIRANLLDGARQFNQMGFTHVRDLTCKEDQWHATVSLFEANELALVVDQFFDATGANDFSRALDLCLKAKAAHPKNLRPRGVKVFLDGALGSEGAYLSQPYTGSTNRGYQLVTDKDLTQMMLACIDAKVDFAMHALGDASAQQIATVANKIFRSNSSGGQSDLVRRMVEDYFATNQLHIEHAQVMRDETIHLLKGLPVTLHMQPCHFLSDRAWLRAKLGTLYDSVFPWAKLEATGFKIFFGSDAPIERASLRRQLEAIEFAAADGILRPQKPAYAYMSYPDTPSALPTYTEFANGEVVRLIFEGKPVDIK